SEESSVEIDSIAYDFITNYLNTIKKGMRSGDWSAADKALAEIDAYQKEWGKNVLPSQTKVDVEILYNKFNVFFWLMIAYCMIGGILILLTFIEVLSAQNKFGKIIHYFT